MLSALATRAVGAPLTIRRRMQYSLAAGACLLGTVGAFAATGLAGSVIANGGGTAHSAGGCYQLTASVGQAAAGNPASGGTYAVRNGFLAGHGDTESVFHQGFEVCS